MSSPEHTLAAGRLIARLKAPYFREALHALAVVETPGLGTIGVTKDAVLMVDFDFIAQCSVDEVAGLLVHECVHLLLSHGARTLSQALDHRTANKAADFVANPTVIDLGLKLPGGGPGVTLEHPFHGLYPEEHGFPRGLSMEEYYRLLKDKEAQDAKNAPGEGEPAPSPGLCAGRCGSCGGNPLPNEPKADHPAARSKDELGRVAKVVAEEIRAAAESSSPGRGTVPASLKRWADAFLAPPEIPWQRELDVAIRHAVTFRAGTIEHTYRKVSRRQAGIGFGVGHAVLPAWHAPVPQVAVIVDTSGSMTRSDLAEALRESAGIFKSVGAEVRACACDAEVHALQRTNSVGDLAKLLKGGGGTDMRPAIKAVSESKPRPSVVVVFTDGDVGDIGREPPGIRFIWVVVGAHQVTRTLRWGRILQLKHRTKRAQ